MRIVKRELGTKVGNLGILGVVLGALADRTVNRIQPLAGALGFRSISHQPLYLGPAAQADEVRDAGRYHKMRRMLSTSKLPYYSLEGASEEEIDEFVDGEWRTTAADNQKGEQQ